VLTTALHLLQPLVRLQGRLSRGLTLWRKRGAAGLRWPRRRRLSVWSEGPWRSLEEWLRTLEQTLVERGAVVRRGGEFDTWDFEVRGGVLAGTRVLATVEEHGEERQLLHFASRPRWSFVALAAVAVLAALAGGAAASGAFLAAAIVAVLAGLLAVRTVAEAAGATGLALHGIRAIDPFGEKTGGDDPR
jgi:hypothetical protein